MFRASAFKLRMYETCPQQYKFAYIDHLADEYKKPKPYLTMGAHVHNALHDFYEQYEPAERSWDVLEQLLRKRWRENRKGFSGKDDEAKWGIKALQMLKQYYHKNDVTVTPVMLEDYYDMDIADDIKLIGRIDRADTYEDGLHVIDYKTGKYDEDDISNTQLVLYAMIVGANSKLPVHKASYLYLATNQWHTIDIANEMYEAAAEDIVEQVEIIKESKEFPATINKYCKHCDFIDVCPRSSEVKQLIESGTLPE